MAPASSVAFRLYRVVTSIIRGFWEMHRLCDQLSSSRFAAKTQRIAAACLGAAAVAWLATAPATAQLAAKVVPTINQFFRFKAEYMVKATGEVVRFDLVRPCQPQYAKDLFGDSIGLGPLGGGKFEPRSYFNAVNRFPKVTKDGHAIVVKIPWACKGQTTENGKVPPDLLPFVSWFEDADDLSVGLMYATEDAYRSPVAKIEFRGASIEAADAKDFQEWLKRAPADFRPSKEIRSPLGFTADDIYGGGSIAQFCRGVSQMELPSDLSRLLAAARPSSQPRYWNRIAAEQAGTVGKLDGFYKALHDDETSLFGGFKKSNFNFFNYNGGLTESSPTSAHGQMGQPSMRPIPVYPYAHIPDGLRTAAKNKEMGLPLYSDVDLRPEMRGFLSCFERAGSKEMLRLYPGGGADRFEWRANGEMIDGQRQPGSISSLIPEPFFENDTHYYFPAEVL